jgi:RimJ/RimL family protein N-acetyltransferase
MSKPGTSPPPSTPRTGSRTPPGEKGQVVELRDGTRALIRPIGSGDRKRLNEGFESASPESIFLRFLAPQPRLTSRQLDYLTAVDHVRHEALIAVDPETGQSFGTARYIRSEDDPETAEFAVGVGDRWMRIGLGTALLRALVLKARDAGVVRFTGLIHPDNTAIRRLVERIAGPYETRSAGQGTLEIVFDLRTRGAGTVRESSAERVDQRTASGPS